eukprot:403372151
MRGQKLINLERQTQIKTQASIQQANNLRDLIQNQPVKKIVIDRSTLNQNASTQQSNLSQKISAQKVEQEPTQSLFNTDQLINQINQKSLQRKDEGAQKSVSNGIRNANQGSRVATTLNPINIINKQIKANTQTHQQQQNQQIMNKQKQMDQQNKHTSSIFDRIKSNNQVGQQNLQYDTQEDDNLSEEGDVYDDEIDFNQNSESFMLNQKQTDEYAPLVVKTNNSTTSRIIRQLDAAPYSTLRQGSQGLQGNEYHKKKIMIDSGSKNLVQQSLQQPLRSANSSADKKGSQTFEIEVLNITSQATEQSLKIFFTAFGRLNDIMYDPYNQRAVVTFSSQEGYQKALQLADNKQLGDQVISVKPYDSLNQTNQHKNEQSVGMLVSDKDIKLVVRSGQNGRSIVSKN